MKNTVCRVNPANFSLHLQMEHFSRQLQKISNFNTFFQNNRLLLNPRRNLSSIWPKEEEVKSGVGASVSKNIWETRDDNTAHDPGSIYFINEFI